MSKTHYCTALMISLCFLNSCTLYQKPKVPELHNPPSFKTQALVTSPVIKTLWWEQFNDPLLNNIVAQALKNNYDYQIALKNIQIADTYVLQSFTNLFPQADITFGSSRNKSAQALVNSYTDGTVFNPAFESFSNVFGFQQLTANISYQLDIWNQVHNTIKQAKANQSASISTTRGVKLVLISQVVNTYFQISGLIANIHNLQAQKKIIQNLIQLYDTQYHSGLIDFNTVDDAKNQVETIQTTIDSLEKQQYILQFTLAYLCGEYPEKFNVISKTQRNDFHHLNIIPPGIPANMMANRPDIQAAYYQVLSYGYLEKENLANFLPAVSITGEYGYASNTLAGLISAANSYWTLGIFATQYLLDYPTHMSQYKRAQYQYQTAILNYKKTALKAFKEVDGALSSYQEDNKALLTLHKQHHIAQNKFQLANAQYQAGLVDYTAYLNANIQTLQSSYNLMNQQVIVVGDIILVYAALGIG